MQHFGSVSWQYATLVSRLELIKKNDPDSLILLKLLADNKHSGYSYRNTEDASHVSDLTSQDGTTRNSFCLRFGAVAITPGTSVRRHRDNTDTDFTSLHVNFSMDACHLENGRGCLTDIIQPMAGDELLVDTFSVDAQNECRDVWHLSLSCDKKALGRSSVHSFCGDRMKGQDNVNQYVYPQVNFTKCHFHLQDNIKKNNDHELECSLFQTLAFSLTDNFMIMSLQKYLKSRANPPDLKNYFKESIMPDVDKWAVHKMSGEKEGLFICQLSESFHQVMNTNNIRLSPIVTASEAIIQYEHETFRNPQKKYKKLTSDEDHPLLSSYHKQIEKRTTDPSLYEIDNSSTDPLIATITSKYENPRYSHVEESTRLVVFDNNPINYRMSDS